MVTIEKTADISGLNPKDYATTPEVFTVAYNEEAGDTITIDEERSKNGKTLQRYTLHLIDKNGNNRTLRYLWKRDLAPLARAFGDEDSTKWGGNKIELSAKKDGEYYNPVLSA